MYLHWYVYIVFCSIFLSLTHCCHPTTLHTHVCVCVYLGYTVLAYVCVHANCNKGNQKTWMNTRLLGCVGIHTCTFACIWITQELQLLKRVGSNEQRTTKVRGTSYIHMYILCIFLCMVMNDNSIKNPMKSNQMYFLFTQQTIAVSFIKGIDEPMKKMNETKRALARVCVCVRETLPVCECVLFCCHCAECS